MRISAERRFAFIAGFGVAAILLHLVLRFGLRTGAGFSEAPLLAALAVGGLPLLWDLARDLLRREWGADLLAGLSIVTAVLLKEYLAGTVIVLMLAGGAALEAYAVRRASSVLAALADRMPSAAHRKRGPAVEEIPLGQVAVGDTLQLFPHEICPVDGTVLEGHGVMDESFLTGEPFRISKAPGSGVLSGAVNGDSALTIRAEKPAADSRYAKIMQVMRASEKDRPRIRRLGDRLGALYTPLALAVAGAAWWMSGSATRFLAVLVIATPCPMIIGIPVAVIGAVSLCARRAIVVKRPSVLEQINTCEVAIFDKTGTLTYGEPALSELLCAPGFSRKELLGWLAALERYSKHPLARAVTAAARREGAPAAEAARISERPGEGLSGRVGEKEIRITRRGRFQGPLPSSAGGLESVVTVDGAYAALLRFRDETRADSLPFIRHLGPKHRLRRILLVSGDRESEVRYLAEQVGITEVHAGQSPEQKLEIVRRETRAARTLFLGDGINDAPALIAATVGVAVGQRSDITSKAAGVVVMGASLKKIDEFMHIGARMRMIALQSALGGMALSLIGMGAAAAGLLSPTVGAVAQEAIDLIAVINALRAGVPPRTLSDYEPAS